MSPGGPIRQKVIRRPKMDASREWLQCRATKTVERGGTYSLSCPMGKKARIALQAKAVTVEVTTWIKPEADEGIFVRKTWKIDRER